MNQNYYNQYNNYNPNQVLNNQMPYQPVKNKKGVSHFIIVIIIALAIIFLSAIIFLVAAPFIFNKSNVKTNDLEIYGGWKTQSPNAETYWVFDNNEFWWYQSYNDLNDNYWYGKVTIETGREGLKNVGLNESSVDTIIQNSNGKVTDDDIYTLTLTPEKIISGGIDKSSTNIPEDSKWHYVWIVVDYGDEGLEGQVLNVDNGDVTYYQRSK